MRLSLSQQLLQQVKAREFVRPGDRVGAAVSGGADSVALLFLLLELREKLGIVLSVVHFNHKLRRKASDADEQFVAKLAAKHGLEFHSTSADVAKKAKKERANLEDAARRARYDYFRSLVVSGACTHIAVAHTADDQAETVLAHILRGSGLAGLGGIHPTAAHIVRPLLDVRRAEIRAYLRSKNQKWREDATNRDTSRLRARIRKKLLPLLEKQFQAEIVRHLATLSELARADEQLLEAVAQESFHRIVTIKDESALISCRDLLQGATAVGFATTEQNTVNSALGRRLVRLLVKRIKPRSGQHSSEHVEAVLELAYRNQSGKRLQLPGGVDVHVEAGTLRFSPASRVRRAAAPTRREFAHTLRIDRDETRFPVPELSCVFRFTVIDWPRNTSDTIDKRSVLDRDALCAPLVLRNWRPGDRFRPLGHRSAHKLKHLLSKLRITGDRRPGWPVLTAGGHVVWCRGLPVAAEFAANERTRSGLVIFEDGIS